MEKENTISGMMMIPHYSDSGLVKYYDLLASDHHHNNWLSKDGGRTWEKIIPPGIQDPVQLN